MYKFVKSKEKFYFFIIVLRKIDGIIIIFRILFIDKRVVNNIICYFIKIVIKYLYYVINDV